MSGSNCHADARHYREGPAVPLLGKADSSADKPGGGMTGTEGVCFGANCFITKMRRALRVTSQPLYHCFNRKRVPVWRWSKSKNSGDTILDSD